MNILITGAWRQAKKHIPQIENMGHKVIFLQQEKDPIPYEYSWPQAAICNNLFLYHNIEQFINLKFIQSTAAGLDRMPMNYITAHKITIKRAENVYSIPIAEFAISGILQLYKHSKKFYEQQNNKEWTKDRNLKELYGSNVCIIGCGSIGTEIAIRLKAFGCKITGVRKNKKSNKHFDKIFTFENLYKALDLAEIIIIACPLTRKTKHMINEDAFKHIKNNSVLVNIARGSIIDQKALEANIDRLYGVVLDVFEEEPLSKDNKLWDKQNVIISPHNSFIGNKNDERLSNLILKNLGELNDK